jgi:hypothetical protein
MLAAGNAVRQNAKAFHHPDEAGKRLPDDGSGNRLAHIAIADDDKQQGKQNQAHCQACHTEGHETQSRAK